jgi:outer membrane murein-binding lipoprotein Lpp
VLSSQTHTLQRKIDALQEANDALAVQVGTLTAGKENLQS